MRFLRSRKKILVIPVLLAFVVAVGTASVALAVCGPFTDVGTLLCPFVLSLYYLGITAGTTSTTFSPGNPVTRGQMAIFMGSLYNQVKRTENPYRVAAGLSTWPFANDHNGNFAGGALSDPIGMCTDGYYVFIGNAQSNNLDLYTNFGGFSNGNPIVLTQTNTGGRIACDNRRVWMGNGGTGLPGSGTISLFDEYSFTITDPWASIVGAVAVNDVANAGPYIAAATDLGVTLIDKNNSTSQIQVNDGFRDGVLFDGVHVWAYGSGTADEIDLFGTIVNSVSITSSGYYGTFDGQNIWIPASPDATSITIIGTKGAQEAQIVEVKSNSLVGTDGVGGLAFTGQYVIATEHGSFGCGSPTSLPVAYDAASHNFVAFENGLCGDGYQATVGWDGKHTWYLAQGSNALRID